MLFEAQKQNVAHLQRKFSYIYIILGNVGKLCGSFQFLDIYSRSGTKIASTSLTAITQCRFLRDTML